MAIRYSCSMRRTLVMLFAIVMAGCLTEASAQDLQPRVPPQKMTLDQMQSIPTSNRVHVKFREGVIVRLTDGQLSGLPSSDAAAFQNILTQRRIPASAIRRMFTRPEADLDNERNEAQQRSGKQLADLKLWYIIDLPRGASAAEVASILNSLDVVEYAEPERLPAPPPVDIAPPTPVFSGNQTYKSAPPTGVGVPTTAEIPGSDGTAIRFADVEYSWRLDHEDLEIPASNTLVPPGRTASDPFADINHGTAVLGEVHGEVNTYGVTGIAPASNPFVAPANYTSGYNPALAINHASSGAGVLIAGDVIIIEQQIGACGGAAYGPLEDIQSVFDAISTATAAGRIVVEAAGNGNVNLDSTACGTKFNRSVRDSGAIIVGAGSSTDHSRLGFSTYGSRVDVQGWGQNVTTTGYGDAFNPGGDERQRYTNAFSGTSSATPIVSGAALAVNGARQACGLPLLNSVQMRTALAASGTPQGNPGTGNIGPLPSVRGAIIASPGGAVCVPSLQVSPATNIAASGVQGALFSPTSFPYQLSASTGSLDFSISGIPMWLNASITSGTATTFPLTVTFSLANPSSLGPNTYTATIAFTNMSSGQGNTTRTATLTVNPGTKDDCKDGGWRNFVSSPGPFKNQGECVSYFARQE
jgi:serine protease